MRQGCYAALGDFSASQLSMASSRLILTCCCRFNDSGKLNSIAIRFTVKGTPSLRPVTVFVPELGDSLSSLWELRSLIVWAALSCCSVSLSE